MYNTFQLNNLQYGREEIRGTRERDGDTEFDIYNFVKWVNESITARRCGITVSNYRTDCQQRLVKVYKEVNKTSAGMGLTVNTSKTKYTLISASKGEEMYIIYT